MTIKHLINHNQTSLQHLLRNKLNIKCFTSDKLKTLTSNIYGLAYMNNLVNWSIVMLV